MTASMYTSEISRKQRECSAGPGEVSVELTVKLNNSRYGGRGEERFLNNVKKSLKIS